MDKLGIYQEKQINSNQNSKAKFVKSLNEKKYRQKENAFYLEGVKVVNEVLDFYLKDKVELEFIVICSSILQNVNGGESLLERLKKFKKNLCIYDFDINVFKYVTDTVNPQGVLAVCKIPKYDINEFLDSNILLLDKVQDMGNMGTILRTANAFNVYNIVCIQGSADIYAPKVVRSTMASILKSKIMYISEFDQIFEILKKNSFTVISTSLATNNYIDKINFKNLKTCLVIGSEANGVSTQILNKSDIKVKIRIEDSVESLNAAVASGILLYKQYIDNI